MLPNVKIKISCALYSIVQGWRTNGTRAIDGTRHIILGTPPITKFTMKYDEEKTQFRANQSKHGNPSRHNNQLGVVKDIPIGACSGIGFYAGGGQEARSFVIVVTSWTAIANDA
ncbi:hypothetical protein AVEN_186222-1 [Araneus ventricosus]|uniref:Uncharacterized protein n=1 Tax=Araneus ventricosus TaxID=182803 RepID=A0A4Y2M5K1_ARAVE|nr:hypothetical protein AVEN_186222-1 [Araneus ventricosus]